MDTLTLGLKKTSRKSTNKKIWPKYIGYLNNYDKIAI